MKIFLTLTDFTVPSYQVKLKFTLTGNGYTISNQSLLNLPAFTLSPGTPLEISGSDLAPYLATQNLLFSGIDVADYDQRKVLPEGPCQICVEVIDFSNPNQAVLSNPACSQVWFSLNDPPLTNTPFCGNEITPSDPQQIIFSWSPLHMNSLHSAGTQYTFELFEIRPDGADPNQVVNSSLPIFMQVTDQTFINYGITEPQLQTGMSYAWRVKAQDIQGRDFFRNNGYSTVCTFTYGNVAASLADGITLTLNSTGTGTRVGFAWWNVSSTFTGYKVEVRKTGNPDYEWFPYESSGGELKIYQLEPSTQYECRVKGLIGDDYESEWSNTSVFTTQPTPDYACGNTTIPPVENTLTPLMNAISGMTFTVGQFDMMVTAIQPLDPILKPGHYSGTGKINVAFLYDVRVSYEDILVDDNLMVRSGKVEAITQGVDAWLLSQIEPDYYVDGTITDFEWTDSTSLTVWVDGQPQTFSFDEHDPIIIQDEDGMIYTFNSDGTYSVFSTLTYSNDVLAATADYRIDFSADEEQQFGFDKKQHSEWIHDYEVIRLIDSTNYFVAYKSIGEGSGDDVIANITSDITLSDVNFIADINGSETALSAEKINDTTYQVHLNGLEESCFVYARHGQLRIGKLWVKVLPEIELDVVIVPVNGATLSNINELQTNLNKIYAQANAKFNVTVAPNFQSTEWDLNADGKVQTGDVDLMSHYSEEMRLLRDTYFETDSNQNAYYLFVIPEFLDADQSGYMVRGKSVGFLKSGETSITAAHELAHGIFSLEHTFPEIEQGGTSNLMDYTSALLSVEQRTHLTQKQWYRIHEPLPAWSMFDLEEEGEMSENFALIGYEDFGSLSVSAVNNSNCNDYLTIWGTVIHLEISENLRPIVKNGKLHGIYLSDYPGKENGYYSSAVGVQTQEDENGDLLVGTRNLVGYFICLDNLNETNCPTVQTWDEKSGFRKQVISKNGTIETIYRSLPSERRFIIEEQEACAPGLEIVVAINEGVAECGLITEQQCQETNGTGIGTLSPDELVKIIEPAPNAIFGNNQVAWLSCEFKPVMAQEFSNLEVSNVIRSFIHDEKQYVSATVKRQGVDVAFGYVELQAFQTLQNEDGEVRVADLQDLLFDEFNIAVNGSEVHYRLYAQFDDCVSFTEYKFIHDGREEYQVRASADRMYYYKDVTGEMVINNSCGLEVLASSLCDALILGGQGIGDMVDELFAVALIPPKHWDPTTSNYNPMAFSIYATVTSFGDFTSLLDLEKQKYFAFLCGLFNGVVYEIGGIGDAMALLSQFICDPNIREQVWNGIKRLVAILSPVLLPGVSDYHPLLDALSDIEESWQGKNIYEKNEFIGRSVIAVVSIVFPVSKVQFVNVMNRGVNLFEKLSAKSLTFLAKVEKGVYNGFEVAGDEIKRLIYNSNSGSLELARISDEGIFIIQNEQRWFDSFESSEVVDDLGASNYKVGEGGVTESDELVVVQKSENEVGFGRRDDGLRIFSVDELMNLSRSDLPFFVNSNLEDLLAQPNRSKIWQMSNESGGQFKRGDLIEEIFNQWDLKYGNYQNLNEIIPNYQTLDFDGVLANFNEVVSLKTYKRASTSLSTMKSTLRSYTQKLNNATLSSAHQGKLRVLDFVIEKNVWSETQLDELHDYIDNVLLNDFLNVAEIRISEF